MAATPCRLHVVLGASPSQYRSVANLVRSIDVHHARRAQLCVSMFTLPRHEAEARNFVQCTRPTLANTTLRLRVFDEGGFQPRIRTGGRDLRRDLLSPYNWFRFYLRRASFPTADGSAAVLYLDTDTLVVGDLSEVFRRTLAATDAFAAASERPYDRSLKHFVCANASGAPSGAVSLNAGVLLLNLSAWEDQAVLRRWSALTRQHERARRLNACGIYRLPGQAELQLLNLSYAVLPSSYNVHDLGCRGRPKDWKDRLRRSRGARILHFNGPSKPWNRLPLRNRARYEQSLVDLWNRFTPGERCHATGRVRSE